MLMLSTCLGVRMWAVAALAFSATAKEMATSSGAVKVQTQQSLTNKTDPAVGQASYLREERAFGISPAVQEFARQMEKVAPFLEKGFTRSWMGKLVYPVRYLHLATDKEKAVTNLFNILLVGKVKSKGFFKRWQFAQWHGAVMEYYKFDAAYGKELIYSTLKAQLAKRHNGDGFYGVIAKAVKDPETKNVGLEYESMLFDDWIKDSDTTKTWWTQSWDEFVLGKSNDWARTDMKRYFDQVGGKLEEERQDILVASVMNRLLSKLFKAGGNDLVDAATFAGYNHLSDKDQFRLVRFSLKATGRSKEDMATKLDDITFKDGAFQCDWDLSVLNVFMDELNVNLADHLLNLLRKHMNDDQIYKFCTSKVNSREANWMVLYDVAVLSRQQIHPKPVFPSINQV